MNIADIKKYKSLDIAKLVKAPWNYKEEDSKLSEKLIANIKRNGQVENLIVRKLDTGCYEIVNGNHRYDALVAVGAKKAIVHDLGVISEVEAKRIAIETNETKFSTDKTKLSDLIDEIVKEFDMEDVLSSMPFTQDEIDKFLSDSQDGLIASVDDLGDKDPCVDNVKTIYVKKGDRIQLGKHRLYCLDVLDIDESLFEMGGGKFKMLLTDPPDGVSYVGKTADAKTIENDDLVSIHARAQRAT
jgi:hypothetical protein